MENNFKGEPQVLSSTHIDKHGMAMSKEALESMATIINSDRCIRLGLEHNNTFPPLGRFRNARIEQGKDGAYYLIAYKEMFTNRSQLVLEDGTVLLKEHFETDNVPFVESALEEVSEMSILIDPVNFESMVDMESFMTEIKDESGMNFSKQMLMRKSEIPDPEMVIKITTVIAATIGIIASQIPKKIGEAIGDDVSKFYKLLRSSVIGMVKNSIPKLRPITFVFEIQDDIIIELIVVSNNPDEVITAFTPEKLNVIKDKTNSAKTIFNAEKIQFTYNEKKEWELNYMLTIHGEAIGTVKSFGKRDKAYQELINKMLETDSEANN